MARKTSIHRQLALATALADGIPEREIARRFAEEWQIQRDSVHVMLKKLLASWASMEPCEHTSISPWNKAPVTIERMQRLRADLSTGEARGSIVQRYAQLWAVQPAYVDKLITRVLDEDQHELIAQSEAHRLRYIERVHAFFARYADVQDWENTSKAYERLTVLTKATS